jgi:signal peptidase
MTMESKLKHAIGVVVLLLIVSPFAAHAFPQAVGAEHSFIVQSGSMEPAIPVGAVIWVEDAAPENVEEGDVITVVTNRAGDTVTHRVIETSHRDGNTYFTTKGDANEEPDSEPRRGDNLVGRVSFVLPFVGHIIAFSQTDLGLVLFLIVPAMLLIVNEVWELYRAAVNDS